MVISRVHSSNDKGQKGRNKNQKASWPKLEQMSPEESLCDSAAALDMLVWLKGRALDPFEPEASKDLVRKFRDETLELREVWRSGTANRPLRKRKLKQFSEEGKLVAASGLASENTNYQNVKKFPNSRSSESALTFDNSVHQKQLRADSNASNYTKNWDSLNKDVSSLVDMDESVNGSSLVNLECFTVHNQPLVDSSDMLSSSNSSSSEVRLQQAFRLLIKESESESDNESESKSESENLPRAVIPIGPKFQAEVPEWLGPVNKGNLYGSDGDSETLKWLGTKMWPIEEGNPRSKMKKIGSGRPDVCSCVSPGSADCIKCHMLLARYNLRSELGPAFLSWKFDEMGEVVSKTWTLKEQHMFESLVKNCMLSKRTDFWECAFKRFPSKCKKNILNYYYNVFIPRRMSREIRSLLDQVVDSDEDQADGDENEGGDWRRCKYRYIR